MAPEARGPGLVVGGGEHGLCSGGHRERTNEPADVRLNVVSDAGRSPEPNVSANAVPQRELVTGLTGTAGCRLVMVGAPAGYGTSQVCA